MRVAVLSGKGGAGKTLVAVNLAAAAGKAVYVDCDVEEPNGRLFLRPQETETSPVTVPVPVFDQSLCDGCRKCVDFCHFNALFFAKNRPMILPDVCHGCGGCAFVCPRKAVSETTREVGVVETGRQGDIQVITGVLHTGEASPVPVIRSALRMAASGKEFTIIDCPPGGSCSVMESISAADRCILVTEPTAFAFHNFKMVHQLASLLGKPCGVVINKAEGPYPPLEEYCAQAGLPVLASVPYSRQTAAACAKGIIASRTDAGLAKAFEGLLEQMGGAGR